jgi:hypothetical protein
MEKARAGRTRMTSSAGTYNIQRATAPASFSAHTSSSLDLLSLSVEYPFVPICACLT